MVIAVNLSLPMATWMRYRGMAWQPTMEMLGATVVFGLMLIAAYRLDLVAKDSVVEVQTSIACPLMLGHLYAGHHMHERSVRQAGHHSEGGDVARRNGSAARSIARFNRRYADPVMSAVRRRSTR